jgi:hypothetical protein
VKEIVMRRLKPIVPALLFLMLYAGVCVACPNCKEAVENQQGTNASGLREGYYWSILFMIGVPFSLLSTGIFFVARAVKRGVLPEM